MSSVVPSPPNRRFSRGFRFKWQLPNSTTDCPGFELHPIFGTLGRCKNCTRGRSDHSSEKQTNLEREHWQRLPLYMDKQSTSNPSYTKDTRPRTNSSSYTFKGVAAAGALSRRSRRVMGSFTSKSLSTMLGLANEEVGSSFDSASTGLSSSGEISLEIEHAEEESIEDNSKAAVHNEGAGRIRRSLGRWTRLSLPRGRRRSRSGSSNSSLSNSSSSVSTGGHEKSSVGGDQGDETGRDVRAIDTSSEVFGRVGDNAVIDFGIVGDSSSYEEEAEEVEEEDDDESSASSASDRDGDVSDVSIVSDQEEHERDNIGGVSSGTNSTSYQAKELDAPTDSDTDGSSQEEEEEQQELVVKKSRDVSNMPNTTTTTNNSNSSIKSNADSAKSRLVWKRLSFGWAKVSEAVDSPAAPVNEKAARWFGPHHTKTQNYMNGSVGGKKAWSFGLSLEDERDEVVTAYVGGYDSSDAEDSHLEEEDGEEVKRNLSYDADSDSDGESNSEESESEADSSSETRFEQIEVLKAEEEKSESLFSTKTEWSDSSSSDDDSDVGGNALIASIAEKRNRHKSSTSGSSEEEEEEPATATDESSGADNSSSSNSESDCSCVCDCDCASDCSSSSKSSSESDSSNESDSESDVGATSGSESDISTKSESENNIGPNSESQSDIDSNSESDSDIDTKRPCKNKDERDSDEDSMVTSTEHRESDESSWDNWLTNRKMSLEAATVSTSKQPVHVAPKSTDAEATSTQPVPRVESRVDPDDPRTALLLHAEKLMNGNKRIVPTAEQRQKAKELRRRLEEDTSDGMQVVLVKFDLDCQPAPAFLLAFDPQHETYTVQWEGGVLQSNVSKNDIFFEVDPVDRAIFLEVCDVTGAARRKRRRKRKEWLQSHGYSFDDGTTDDVVSVVEQEKERESADSIENPAVRYAMFMPEVHEGSLWVAARLGDLGAVRFFVETCGQDVNECQQVGTHDTGRNALFYACMYGHLPVARWLLEHGAKDVDGSAFGAAIGRTDVLALLAQFGQSGSKGLNLPDPEADAVVAALGNILKFEGRFSDKNSVDSSRSSDASDMSEASDESDGGNADEEQEEEQEEPQQVKPKHRPSILKRPSLHGSKWLRRSSGTGSIKRISKRRKSEPPRPKRGVTVNKRALVFMYNGDRSAREQSLCIKNPNTDAPVVQREARAGSTSSHESYLAEVDLPETDEEFEEEEEIPVEIDYRARASAEFEHAVKVGGVDVYDDDEDDVRSDQVIPRTSSSDSSISSSVSSTSSGSISDTEVFAETPESAKKSLESAEKSSGLKKNGVVEEDEAFLKRTNTLRGQSLGKVLRTSSSCSSSSRSTRSSGAAGLGGLLESQSGWM